MGRNRSFEKRAREGVERIKAEEAAHVECKQERMRTLSEQVRKRREASAAKVSRRKEEREGEDRDRFAKAHGSVAGRRVTYDELTGKATEGS